MNEEKNTLKPSVENQLEVTPDGQKPEVSKKDGFELNPKYNSVEEQAKAYGEAQKTITQKSQEVAELKKQLDESKMLFETMAQAQKPAVKTTQNEAETSQVEPQKAYQAKLMDLNAKHKAQVKNINNLFQSGQITLAQAVKLKEHLDTKMNDSTKQVLNLANSLQSDISELRKNKAIEGFKAQKPDFFHASERLEVINYLKSASEDLSNEELENVAKLVEKVEAGAIERFKNSQAQDGLANQMNEQAKVRLKSSVDNSSSIGGERVFTKDDIKKMSNKEFRKNEKNIMNQMRNGKIR